MFAVSKCSQESKSQGRNNLSFNKKKVKTGIFIIFRPKKLATTEHPGSVF
jgi:hypothetical protein